MSWIKHPVVLEDEVVRLEPLNNDHFPALIAIAKNKEIWDQLPVDGSDESVMMGSLREALLKRISGEQYSFTVIDKQTETAIGCTRLFELFENHKKLEIGWTWYAPAYWGKGHNVRCKLLLLTYCFETLGTHRVQLKTRNTNLRSQAAIRKIGGKFEGYLRKDRIAANGEVRDTAVFSIIDDEWPEVKKMLEGIIRIKDSVL